MKIIITGARGHLGGKLALHLRAVGHEVTGLDLVADKDCVAADLTKLSGLPKLLAGQDALVHLAADRSPAAGWATALPNNVDATFNVFEAAREAGVKRVIYASSNWLMGGRRFESGPLSADTLPDVVNPYGISKLIGERIGAFYARAYGMTVICTRIGWVQWTHDNEPGPHMAMGRWGQEMWLSDRDFLNGMAAACTTPVHGFHIVNLMSNNPGMRWSLLETRDVLGFFPQDGASPRLTVAGRLKEFGAWVRQVGMPRLVNRLTGADW